VIAALSSEWLKIRTTRTIYWLLAALAALTTLITVSAVLSNNKKDLIGADKQIGFISIGVVAVLIALIIGLVISTGEFRHGTITATLLSTPSRTLVVFSKAIAGLLLGVLLVAFTEALVIGQLAALLPLRGVDLALQGGDVADVMGRTLAAAAIWGAIGSSLGLALRNQIGTVVGCFVWLFFVEQIVVAILSSHLIGSHAGRFLPFMSTVAVFNDSKEPNQNILSHAGGLATLCVWLVATTLLALVLFRRRNVS
jgi:ABC-2 type transport system permease protein